jgi:hypothetical protein
VVVFGRLPFRHRFKDAVRVMRAKAVAVQTMDNGVKITFREQRPKGNGKKRNYLLMAISWVIVLSALGWLGYFGYTTVGTSWLSY